MKVTTQPETPVQMLKAIAVWKMLAMGRMQPTLICNGHPDIGVAEYSVDLGGSGMVGLLHEEIVKAGEVAERFGGLLWLDTEGKLSIVWPLDTSEGPAEAMSPREAALRAAARERA